MLSIRSRDSYSGMEAEVGTTAQLGVKSGKEVHGPQPKVHFLPRNEAERRPSNISFGFPGKKSPERRWPVAESGGGAEKEDGGGA